MWVECSRRMEEMRYETVDGILKRRVGQRSCSQQSKGKMKLQVLAASPKPWLTQVTPRVNGSNSGERRATGRDT